jgi:hypothetical protein
MKLVTVLGMSLLAGVALGGACGGDDEETNEPDGVGAGGSFPEHTGASCDTAADCYPGLDGGTVEGTVECLEEARDGYCTHTCTDDGDCCAVEGECKTDIVQICSPFQSNDDRYCFLSCEPDDLVGTDDEAEYCQLEASPDFICRSSGGGSDNRKICMPGQCGIGADCAIADDCGGELECITTFEGGYCTQIGCTLDTDCPQPGAGQGSRCVTIAGTNYCLRTCTGASDCNFCRTTLDLTDCTDQANFVDSTGTANVCLP